MALHAVAGGDQKWPREFGQCDEWKLQASSRAEECLARRSSRWSSSRLAARGTPMAWASRRRWPWPPCVMTRRWPRGEGVRGCARCIAHPALANERVQCNADGQVVLNLKTSWRDGTTHLVMSPQDFMQRATRAGATAAPVRASARFSPVKDGLVELNRPACSTALGRGCVNTRHRIVQR
jgi:hypothetical protein